MMLKERYKILESLSKQQRNQTSKLELELRQELTQLVKVNSQTKMITSNKFSNSSIFTDEKNTVIDEWLFVMRNKIKVNENWYSTKTLKKTYVRTRLKDDAMKHLAIRFEKDSIKLFDTVDEIFDELTRIFDDLNKRMNVMKVFRRLKQIAQHKEFHIFWSAFQRLADDAKTFDKLILLKDLKNKMSFDLQKILTSEAYKAFNPHEFARLCQFID